MRKFSLLAGIILILSILTSQGRATLEVPRNVDARRASDSDGSSTKDIFPSYDYEGDISKYFDVQGPIIPIGISQGCKLQPPAKHWSPPENDTIDGSIVFFVREQMEKNHCVTYAKALETIPKLRRELSELGFPSVRVVLLAANSNSDENFGSSDEEHFFDYTETKPKGVNVALIGRDTARYLWDKSQNGDFRIIRLTQDEGPWNRDRKSVWNRFRIALAWSILLPLMVVSVYLIIQSIRMTGRFVNVQVLIFSGAFLFLLGNIIAPISTAQTRVQVYVRYISWLCAYPCYCWVILAWANIIKKTQSPRFLLVMWAVTYTGVMCMFLFAMINITITVYPTVFAVALKKWISLTLVPVVLVTQGCLLLFYGLRFLAYIRESVLFSNIQLALRKLTVLSLGTFTGFLLFAVCTTLNQSMLHSPPWVMTLRSLIYNLTSFVLVILILWIVRIHDSSMLVYHKQTRVIDNIESNHKRTARLTRTIPQRFSQFERSYTNLTFVSTVAPPVPAADPLRGMAAKNISVQSVDSFSTGATHCESPDSFFSSHRLH
ncbi:hypothetical protein IWQ61_002765 [Dispira simplex]|nr:hypothetical protein IWQ61_002765 [Dispira simplex]